MWNGSDKIDYNTNVFKINVISREQGSLFSEVDSVVLKYNCWKMM